MKKELKEMLLNALDNNHPHKMGQDYYVSVQTHWGEEYEVILYPQERYSFWTGYTIEYLISYEKALNIRLTMETENGVTVAKFR